MPIGGNIPFAENSLAAELVEPDEYVSANSVNDIAPVNKSSHAKPGNRANGPPGFSASDKPSTVR
jgi:hypothetical protein